MIVTVPVLPSTRSRCPVLIVLVPKAVPVTAGSPYSRQTMAAGLMMPPTARRGDLAEHRSPARRGQRRHQDLAFLQVSDAVRGEDDPGRALGDARGSRE